MSERILSGLFETPQVARVCERDQTRTETKSVERERRWNPENFAREQIRGLVRLVFFSNTERPPIRQVVFSGVEQETDVHTICRRVGEALALETTASIAVVGAHPQMVRNFQEAPDHAAGNGNVPLRQIATRVQANVWLVPPGASRGNTTPTASLHSLLFDLRREFDYSIVESPPAGDSNSAAEMAQLADGIILVLSAHRTRHATARKIKETLDAAQARILGAVLSDRVFPIPEKLYRRL